MTLGTLGVLLAVWVALEAWRDWPGPVHLLARLASVRRVGRRSHRPQHAAQSGVIRELTPGATVIQARPLRPLTGSCPGCGAAEDEWCREGCNTLDPGDSR